jgi:hypothetical protein
MLSDEIYTDTGFDILADANQTGDFFIVINLTVPLPGSLSVGQGIRSLNQNFFLQIVGRSGWIPGTV